MQLKIEIFHVFGLFGILSLKLEIFYTQLTHTSIVIGYELGKEADITV
jgi:hypothetical protein